MRIRWFFVSVALVLLTVAGCGVNKSFRIDDGTTRSNGIMTVNGSIRIGSDCSIGGDCTTVNGRISIGDRTKVEGLQTVNGRIEIGEGCEIAGDVDTVNGRISCGPGSRISGDAGAVNGSISLVGARVEHDVTTSNGDVDLVKGAFVGGDVLISGGSSSDSTIEVRIADDSIVAGDVRIKGHRKARVILSNGGEVQGAIHGAEIVREEGSAETDEVPVIEEGEDGDEEEG
jgi:cytoskeletal protein CcmA (bactofilin family)